MKEFVPVLKRTKLFSGVGEDDIAAMLSCLGARLRTFKKGEYVLRQGAQREKNCSLISPKRQRNRTVLTSRSRLTGSSLRTTCLLTEVQCRTNCVR